MARYPRNETVAGDVAGDRCVVVADVPGHI